MFNVIAESPITGVCLALTLLVCFVFTGDFYILAGIPVPLLGAYLARWSRNWDRKHGIQ